MHFKRLAESSPCYHPCLFALVTSSHLTCNKMPTLALNLEKERKSKVQTNPFPIPLSPSQTVIFISSSQVSNMFQPWQFENIWSQSNATFNCSKLNLIDSPTNSCLLKASSIRSWFFRLLNILWFHPGFYIQLQLIFSSTEKNWKCLLRFILDFVESGITSSFGSPIVGGNNQKRAFSTFLLCNLLLSNKLPLVYNRLHLVNLSIYSTSVMSTCSLSASQRTLELYRTCYFLASNTQQLCNKSISLNYIQRWCFLPALSKCLNAFNF